MAAPPITVLVVDGTSTRASTLRLLTAAGYSVSCSLGALSAPCRGHPVADATHMILDADG